MLYINGFVSTLNELYKLMERFFRFQISFWNFVRKPKILAKNWKNFQKNSEAWILIKLQCVLNIYQWIRLNELYKLLESFFQILNSFSSYWPKFKKYSTHNKVGFMNVF